MPNIVPTLNSKLVPLWDFAIGAGCDPKALREELVAAGIPICEIKVRGQRSAFVERDDLDRFITRGSTSASTAPQPIPDDVQARLESQAAELEKLKAQVQALIARGQR